MPLGLALLPVDAGPVAEPFLGDLEAVARSRSLLLLLLFASCPAATTRGERHGNGRVWRDGKDTAGGRGTEKAAKSAKGIRQLGIHTETISCAAISTA